MSEQWQHQLRVYFDDAMAERAFRDGDLPELEPLKAVLSRHDARVVSQWQAFTDYVAESEAAGKDDPLAKWTKATLADPAMRAKHIGSFAVRVGDAELYPREAADALEADLRPLVGGALVKRMTRHDTDPAKNIPVPEQYRA